MFFFSCSTRARSTKAKITFSIVGRWFASKSFANSRLGLWCIRTRCHDGRWTFVRFSSSHSAHPSSATIAIFADSTSSPSSTCPNPPWTSSAVGSNGQRILQKFPSGMPRPTTFSWNGFLLIAKLPKQRCDFFPKNFYFSEVFFRLTSQMWLCQMFWLIRCHRYRRGGPFPNRHWCPVHIRPFHINRIFHRKVIHLPVQLNRLKIVWAHHWLLTALRMCRARYRWTVTVTTITTFCQKITTSRRMMHSRRTITPPQKIQTRKAATV